MLNLAFGPNNLLALTHGARQGVGFALRASMGRLLAFAPMIALSGLGLGLLLSASATAFTALKVIGAAYLIWLGLRLLRSDALTSTASFEASAPDVGNAFRREALVALGNPKAILVFAAFFPQFVDPQAYTTSYAVLGALFMMLEVVAICCYAVLGRFAARAASNRLHWFSRASGLGMIGFGVAMVFARRPDLA